MPSFARLALAVAPLFLVARADVTDFELDDDVSSQCRSICAPVAVLSDRCEVDLSDNTPDEDRTEDLLEAQCYCTHNGFDVAGITALCADCIRQFPRGDDDDDDDDDNDVSDALEDINAIMFTCGFSSTTFAAAATTSAAGISVSAVRPTAASQLTTTITGGTQAVAEPTGANNDNADDTNADDTNADDADADPDSLAMPSARVSGGIALAGAIGAVVLLL
ncbi:hypothetical protein S40288_00360 [Stachybotrys chartarum IBT 40288]|nr:hypothetical protein S40288_00360 [Stachybotrys chartarum IBT 40288]